MGGHCIGVDPYYLTHRALGLTFKENSLYIRNTKVIDIINEPKEYTPNILVHDPHADPEEAKKEYGIELVGLDAFKSLTAVVVAVGHEKFSVLTADSFKNMLNWVKLVVDVNGKTDKVKIENLQIKVIGM